MRPKRAIPARKIFFLLAFLLTHSLIQAQETFPVNGVADLRSDFFAFTNATIVKDAQTTLQHATLVIKQGKIIAVGENIPAPKDAVVLDCKGKYIYPSFIALYSNYGIQAPAPASSGSFDFFRYLLLLANVFRFCEAKCFID